MAARKMRGLLIHYMHSFEEGVKTTFISTTIDGKLPSFRDFIKSDDNDDRLHPPSLDFLDDEFDDKIWIKASTKQGLLFCMAYDDNISNYIVCDPSTQQYQRLPKPSLTWYASFGIQLLNSYPLRFKVVKFPCYSKSRHYEVFDSDLWCWKQRVRLENDQYTLSQSHTYKPPVSICGALHWLTTDNICAMDIEEDKENFRFIPFPKPIDLSKDNAHIIDYEAKLGLILPTSRLNECEGMELWIYNSQDRLWTMRHSFISLEFLMQDTRPYFRHSSQLVALCEGDVVEANLYNQFLLAKFRTFNLNFDKVSIFPYVTDGQWTNLNIGNKRKHEEEAFGSNKRMEF
ncbi:hypothetical protein ACFE04_030814 [Oxalis oulophora]